MPASVHINLRALFLPSLPSGTANAAEYNVPIEAVIGGTTDTMVQLEMVPDDYAGGGTDPVMHWELAGGSGPMDPIVTAGLWANKVLVNNVNGETQDWSAIRALVMRAMPAVEGAPAAATGVVILGNQAGGDHDRLVLPINFDSADTGSTPECGAIVTIPGGFDWDVLYPLSVTLYSCTNLRLLLALRGA